MKRRHLNLLLTMIAAVALVNATACKKEPGSSPTAIFGAFYEASKNKDVAGVKKTFSKITLELFEREAKEQNKTVDEMLKTGMERKPMPDKMPETRNEKINGNDATLEVHDEKGGRWDTVTFFKEDGQWKIALDKLNTQTTGAK